MKNVKQRKDATVQLNSLKFVQKQFLESAFLEFETNRKSPPTDEDLKRISILAKLSYEQVNFWF